MLELDRMTSPTTRLDDASIVASLNALFRTEFKRRDERYFRGRRGDLTVSVQPTATYPKAIIRLKNGEQTHEELMELSHLALAKILTEYEFQSVLDIGAGWGAAARCFNFLGKDLHTVEMVADRSSGITTGGDYVQTPPLGPFDLVWASHVLEHQRNVGAFLDKVFTDTREGGLVAITIPSALSSMIIGHPTIMTPLHLIYHLILAGFDCREARVKNYDWQFSVIVQKRANCIRPSNIAATHYPQGAPDFYPDLLKWFPIDMPQSGDIWGEVDAIKW
jgi:hypothetical protein